MVDLDGEEETFEILTDSYLLNLAVSDRSSRSHKTKDFLIVFSFQQKKKAYIWLTLTTKLLLLINIWSTISWWFIVYHKTLHFVLSILLTVWKKHVWLGMFKFHVYSIFHYSVPLVIMYFCPKSKGYVITRVYCII